MFGLRKECFFVFEPDWATNARTLMLLKVDMMDDGSELDSGRTKF